MARYGRRYGNFYGTNTIEVSQAEIPGDTADSLEVEWTTQRTGDFWTLIYVDRVRHGYTNQTRAQIYMRQRELHLIELFEAGFQNWDEEITVGLLSSIPGDKVRLSWDQPSAGSPTEYRVYWDSGTGTIDYDDALAIVKDTGAASYSWTSGHLTDGTYKFAVRARNESTNEETNITYLSLTVSSVPEPATGLAYSFNDGTHELTLSWTASVSSDVAGYRIYSNGGSGAIDYTTPIDSTTGTSWTYDMTGLTGHYKFGIRAYDASALEELNMDVWQSIVVDSGDLAMPPNAPSGLAGIAIADAKVRLSWRYNRTIPQDQLGTCSEFRVYYDNATGTMDYVTAIGTVSLDGRFITFDTASLTGGLTYKFGVRSATADGVEENNTVTVSVEADSTPPSAPESLSGEVVV